MKKFSYNIYECTSLLSTQKIKEILDENVLLKEHQIMYLTKKPFIGQVKTDSFKIISSSFPMPHGAFCVINGHFKHQTKVLIEASLHPIFRRLHLIWVIIFIFFGSLMGIINAIDMELRISTTG